MTLIIYWFLIALQVPSQRVSGFVKRLCTVSLHSQANGALAFLSYVKSFLQVEYNERSQQSLWKALKFLCSWEKARLRLFDRKLLSRSLICNGMRPHQCTEYGAQARTASRLCKFASVADLKADVSGVSHSIETFHVPFAFQPIAKPDFLEKF
mgnify:FL=1